MDYAEFLESKRQMVGKAGFKPVWVPDFLYDFQEYLVEWAVRMGRAAIFADCGLGKTPMQLVWAENVVRKTNKPVLIATPLAVSYQTLREAEKFGIEAKESKNGKSESSSVVVVTNYERLHHFDRDDFGGMVADESSIIKHHSAATRRIVTEFMRTLPYRLLCTATAAPNDFPEVGTSSEALGYLGYQDMITRFFKEESVKGHLGWGRKKYRFRGHAADLFWDWVRSWARVCRKPSDLGFDDDGFVLPELRVREEIIKGVPPKPGTLLTVPAVNLHEQRQERRRTLRQRCGRAAEIASGCDSVVVWCHLNDEADLLEKMIPGSKQVSGSQSEELKEERLLAFQAGDLKKLITKPKIGCFGLNWQHCHDVVMFPSHSWEQYYQAVRRCWRFGQEHPVDVMMVTSKGEQRVLKNLKRKAEQADEMFNALTRNTRESHVDSGWKFEQKEEIPPWL